LRGRKAPTESYVKPARTLDTLPDDVLREIFAFCVSCPSRELHTQTWKSLVQVCKRWREIIYTSQHYLDLFLYLRLSRWFPDELKRTLRVKETIDSWPEVPLYLEFWIDEEDELKNDTENLHAALMQRDRITHMQVSMMGREGDWFADLIREEFRQLKHLELRQGHVRDDEVAYMSFDRLLGGSAPSLQYLSIRGFDYEGLPSLLSSAPNLISLQITNIRYMSPEEIAGALAGLTKLRELTIAFSFFIPIRESHNAKEFQTLGSPTHAVFPALTKLQIEADNAYLENLIKLIDAPRLDGLHLTYRKPDEGTELRAGNLSHFIGRTETFKNAQFRCAKVTLNESYTYVILGIPRDEYQQTCLSHTIQHPKNLYQFVDTVSHVTNWLEQLVMMLSDVQSLSINNNAEGTMGIDCVLKNINWLRHLRSFSAIEAQWEIHNLV